jgi:hypothetical protein
VCQVVACAKYAALRFCVTCHHQHTKILSGRHGRNDAFYRQKETTFVVVSTTFVLIAPDAFVISAASAGSGRLHLQPLLHDATRADGISQHYTPSIRMGRTTILAMKRMVFITPPCPWDFPGVVRIRHLHGDRLAESHLGATWVALWSCTRRTGALCPWDFPGVALRSELLSI